MEDLGIDIATFDVSILEDILHRKPKEPLQEECCGRGCNPCIFDIYDQELKIWKAECKKILKESLKTNDESASAEQNVISEMEYRKFAVSRVENLTENVKTYRFTITNGGCLNLRAGQHLILRSIIDGVSVCRQYTPISPLDAEGYFDVLIKIYSNGLMSQDIHNWKEGIMCEWRGPFGEFQYQPNKFSHIVMLAAGTGITPMTHVIRTVLDNDEDETRIQLLYSCTTYNDIYLKKLLDEWKQFWNFSVTFHVTQETDVKCTYGDRIVNERISSAYINHVLGSFTSDFQILICGPRKFNKDMKEVCLTLSVEEERLFTF